MQLTNVWARYIGWGCFAAAFVFLALAIAQWKKVHSRLEIHWAQWYGNDRNKSIEKTAIVRGWVTDNMIHHHVHQDELGDIPPHEAKKLEVNYSLGASKGRTIVVTNGNDLVIPDRQL